MTAHSGSDHGSGPRESRTLYILAVALVAAWVTVGAVSLVFLALRFL
jgi:hypothetical protein